MAGIVQLKVEPFSNAGVWDDRSAACCLFFKTGPRLVRSLGWRQGRRTLVSCRGGITRLKPHDYLRAASFGEGSWEFLCLVQTNRMVYLPSLVNCYKETCLYVSASYFTSGEHKRWILSEFQVTPCWLVRRMAYSLTIIGRLSDSHPTPTGGPHAQTQFDPIPSTSSQ